MNVTVEKLDGQMAKLTVEIDAEVFEKAIDTVYKKQRSRISVPGFRKGKAPRKLIEQMYGKEVFYEDAADEVIKTEYPKAYDECEEEIVSQPDIDIINAKSGENFVFTATVALRPEVKLGKYEGVSVTKQDTKVTEKDIEEEIKFNLKRDARTLDITDRPVQADDTANIDYLGKKDGVPFEGGKGEGYNLKIGSNTFIPGFEDQVIGHSIGEEFDINVTFPEEYHSKDLAGADAIFTVKINSIKAEEIPELNDEYVSDSTEFETVAEYKEDIKKKLEDRKAKAAARAKEEEAIEKVVADSEIEIPEAMLDTQVNSMVNEYARGMMNQGISMEQYFSMTGMNINMLMEQMRPDAEKQIRTSLVLEEIVKKEGITASDEDVDKRIEEMGAMYGISLEDLKKSMTENDTKNLKKEIEVQKAAELVGEKAKEKAKSSKKKEDKEEGKEEE